MAEVKLPDIREGQNDRQMMQNLLDGYHRLRKELEFLLGGNIDDDNVSSISTDKLVAGYAKIGTALIESLIVGTNVQIGTAQDAAGVTTIIGGVVTTDYVNALNVTAGSVAAENITGTTITGKTISGCTINGGSINVETDMYIGNSLRLSGDGERLVVFGSSAFIALLASGVLYASCANGTKIEGWTFNQNGSVTGEYYLDMQNGEVRNVSNMYTRAQADARYIRPYYSGNYCHLDYSSSTDELLVRDTEGNLLGYIAITPP
jgi:hypothetical protein